MADEKLVEEVAQQLAMDDGGSRTGLQYIDMSRGIFRNPALIKRMAEGVGLEVKEKPARYIVTAGALDYFIRDRELRMPPIMAVSNEIGLELARRWCQEKADELNQKERG